MRKKACWGLKGPADEIKAWREIEDGGNIPDVYWTPVVFPISTPEGLIVQLCKALKNKGLGASYHLSIENTKRDIGTVGGMNPAYEVFWVVNITHLCADTTLEPNPWRIIPEVVDAFFGKEQA